MWLIKSARFWHTHRLAFATEKKGFIERRHKRVWWRSAVKERKHLTVIIVNAAGGAAATPALKH